MVWGEQRIRDLAWPSYSDDARNCAYATRADLRVLLEEIDRLRAAAREVLKAHAEPFNETSVMFALEELRRVLDGSPT